MEGTIASRDNSVLVQTCLGTNVSGHKHVWVQTCLGTNVPGRSHVVTVVWSQTCLGAVMWSQSCGHNHVWAQTWWNSTQPRGRTHSLWSHSEWSSQYHLENFRHLIAGYLISASLLYFGVLTDWLIDAKSSFHSTSRAVEWKYYEWIPYYIFFTGLKLRKLVVDYPILH